MYTVAVLVFNNLCVQGEKEDKCGPLIRKALTNPPFEVIYEDIIPVKEDCIEKKLLYTCDSLEPNLVFTAGGTGLGPSDKVPEITKALIDREIPGIPEAMRAPYYKTNPKVMVSRATAGLRGKTLIINLPGSSNGTKESLDVIKAVLPRILGMVQKKEVSHGAH